MKQDQYSAIGKNRDAFHKFLTRFYVMGARWQHLVINPAKTNGLLKVTALEHVRFVAGCLYLNKKGRS